MNEVLWWIAIIIAVVVFFVLIIFVVLRYSRDYQNIGQSGSSLSVLHDRYLKREITSEQLQEMNKELEEKSPEHIIQKFLRYL
ncbi:MAG: hypothetical protein LUQ50_07235 [Methanospirillum sp.]|nr:hypothetical protein [Methanospirillum sp.]